MGDHKDNKEEINIGEVLYYESNRKHIIRTRMFIRVVGERIGATVLLVSCYHKICVDSSAMPD
ncbi:MAG: hypothetical protein M1526_01940 [Candidatus Thermoplasmatota archaeon]|nr:hypothetical protein [Candidatus Thermoplasmatota archaeon]